VHSWKGYRKDRKEVLIFFAIFAQKNRFFAVFCGFCGFLEVFQSRGVFGSKLSNQKYGGGNKLGPNLR